MADIDAIGHGLAQPFVRSTAFDDLRRFGGIVPEGFTSAGAAFRVRGASPWASDGFAHLARLADSLSLVDAGGALDIVGGTRALCTAFEAWLASVGDERTEFAGTSIVYSRLVFAIADAAHARNSGVADAWRDAVVDVVEEYYDDAEHAHCCYIAGGGDLRDLFIHDAGDTLSLLDYLIAGVGELDHVRAGEPAKLVSSGGRCVITDVSDSVVFEGMSSGGRCGIADVSDSVDFEGMSSGGRCGIADVSDLVEYI